MIDVSIIGSGNLAQHLIAAFEASESTTLVQIYARDRQTVSHLVNPGLVTEDLETLKEADLYLIAATDAAIAEISSNLPFRDRLVAHTSGSVAVDAIDAKNRRAVFYPLQTFTRNKPVNFKEIPICIETGMQADMLLLEQVASALSDSIYRIDSQQRKALHVAAVFVSNFTNHLYKIGSDICAENGLPFNILKPLIAETANKVRLLSPEDAQTGPARRHDFKTIEAHLDFLKADKREVYELLTQSIINNEQKL